MVVESPGRLPGLVRAENIRYTHFSRNPKIAEFLKTYSFVKEYGEGVDRMYKELEAAGLRALEYYINSFMLQAIIYNSNIEKPENDNKKPEIEDKKSEIQNEKLDFEKIKSEIQKRKYNEPTIDNILRIYNEIETNQVFGSSDVRKILDCSSSTASEIMSKLRELEVVVAVKGKGKGKSRFINKDES